MANSLLKTIAHNSFADSIYNELLIRASRYYYFIGKTIRWADESTPPEIIDSLAYEWETRNEIIALKDITPSDVSYVIPRKDWQDGTVYDEYDDQYSTEVQGINLINGGQGYPVSLLSAPVVTIGDLCPLRISVVADSQYYYNSNVYTVIKSGITGPTNTSVLGPNLGSIYEHGTATLKCVGLQARATCLVGTSNNIQKIISTTITFKGSGYISPPSVKFTSNLGTGAVAVGVLTNGVNGTSKLEDTNYYTMNVNNVYVCIDNNNGAPSTVAPTIVSSGFSTPSIDGYIWKYMYTIPNNSKFLTDSYIPVVTAYKNQYSASGSVIGVSINNAGSGYVSASSLCPVSTHITSGNRYYYNGHVYVVTTTGTTGVSNTVLGIDNGTNYPHGSAYLTCLGLVPYIVVEGDGLGAVLTPLITNGRVSSIQITNPGTGYTYINLTLLGAPGINAKVSASLHISNITDSNQAQIEHSTVQGNIFNIPIISEGYGYSDQLTVSIIGDGKDATATATQFGGKITNINITNRGSDYNWAKVIVTDSAGAGGQLRAVISPFGGLGKDSINQLCARSLMFYAKISDNNNQGLLVSNDYRQIGIIKDPIKFNDNTWLYSNFASTCWKIVASAVISNIVLDEIVTSTASSISYRYRVVSIDGNNILLLSLDNGVPAANSQFINNTNKTFVATSVTEPTVNKYSGDLMFIDNRSTFIATHDAPAILRTVINF